MTTMNRARQAAYDALKRGGTATASGLLVGAGLKRTWMQGPKQLIGKGAVGGPGFTISFLPGREDITTKASYAAKDSIMAACDIVPEGAVVVIDARGDLVSGTVGDILLEMLKRRGARGVITDGAVRDLIGLRRVGLPVWAAANGAPEAIVGLHYAGHSATIGCGGVLVMPNDTIVADEDGAVLIPSELTESYAEQVTKKVDYELFVLENLAEGRPLKGLYPTDAATEQEYAAWSEKNLKSNESRDVPR